MATHTDPFQRNIFSFYARFGESKLMEAILKEKSKTMDEVNHFGESPLFIAIKVMRISIMIE